MKELDLPWSKLKRVTTDGAASTTGKKTDLIGRIQREKNPEFYSKPHCVIQ
jgi:hypothetical protein